MTEVLKAGVLSDEIDLGALAHNAAEQAEEFVRKASVQQNTEWLMDAFHLKWTALHCLTFLWWRKWKKSPFDVDQSINHIIRLGMGSILEGMPLSSFAQMATRQ